KFEVRDGRFELPCRNPEAPVCLAFLDADHNLGAVAAFAPGQAGGEPVTVTLAPCGSATARLVDAKGKPLADYRPLLWLSVPVEPSSSPKELEGLLKMIRFSTDTVWAGVADPRHYGDGPKTDAQGRITFPTLIPGATYRVALFGGAAKDFKA